MGKLMIIEGLIVFGATMFFASTPLGSKWVKSIRIWFYNIDEFKEGA